MDDDAELLRRFADDGSEAAFTELVRRKVDLIYAAALRQTGGDSHLAQDVVQGVFLALAQRARALQRHTMLTAWLYTTTRYIAAKAVRTQARWQRREQEAHTMNSIARENVPTWSELRPVIDEAMHELPEKDRAALLLRFFEGRPLADVGKALGLAENAARMRVDRALDKLRTRLARRGIASTAAALGSTLAAQPAVTAPAGFAAAVAGTSISGLAAGATGIAGAGSGTLFSKLSLVTGAVALALIFGWYSLAASRIDEQFATERSALDAQIAQRTERNAQLRKQFQAQVSASAATDPLAMLRAVARIAKDGGLGTFRWNDLIRSGPPDIALMTQLFALTPDENASLLHALETAFHEITAASLATATRSKLNDRQFAIIVAPLPAAAESHQRLLATLQSVLGPERYGLFQQLEGVALVEQRCQEFGLRPFTVIVSRLDNPRQREAPFGYDRTEGADVRVLVNRVTTSGAEASRDSIRQYLGPFYALVPEDFWDLSKPIP